MTQPKIIQTGTSPVIGCECGEQATYHKRDDGTTIYRCDLCNREIGWSKTEIAP